MHEIQIVKRLCNAYGLDFDEAIIIADINTKPEIDDMHCNKKDYTNEKQCINQNYDNIKPFDGIVKSNCCKAVVYNHGLYTQCVNETTREFCSSVCKRLKYGHINVRKNYPVGTYVLENGKKEISYSKVKKRLEKKSNETKNNARIITEDSDEDIDEIRDLSVSKNARGRPKMPNKEIEICVDSKDDDYYKDEDDNVEEVLVRRETINNTLYLVSENNVVFHHKTYKMLGKLVLGKIVWI